jgi:hypothetical protein
VLAVKSLVVKNHSDSTRVLRVEKSTKGPITGADIQTDDAVEVLNKDLGQEFITWDNPLLFGPVPANLQASGDVACLRARVDLQAFGFHPRAKDLQGQALPGGGYYCYPKVRGSEPDAKAPRLSVIEGVLGWDRPAAFGRVPADQQARGDAVCERFAPGMKAIAYHPKAEQQNGQTIVGGGFFCAKPILP